LGSRACVCAAPSRSLMCNTIPRDQAPPPRSSSRGWGALACACVRGGSGGPAIAGPSLVLVLVEDRQVEESEPLGVIEEVEFDDLAVPHCDGGDRERLPVE